MALSSLGGALMAAQRLGIAAARTALVGVSSINKWPRVAAVIVASSAGGAHHVRRSALALIGSALVAAHNGVAARLGELSAMS